MEENKTGAKNSSTQQIAGAIIVAGIIIGGAILLKDNNSAQRVDERPIAKTIGLNVKAFDACLESGKFKDKVQASIDDGTQAGVNGTPSSFILKDGMVIDTIAGAQTFAKIMEQIKNSEKNDKKALDIKIAPVAPDDHIRGDANAKIIIVEYSDLDCPFCKTFHRTMNQVTDQKEINVAWVYRHYPLSQIHPGAFQKAEETECAWEQKGNEGFWKYADALFETAR